MACTLGLRAALAGHKLWPHAAAPLHEAPRAAHLMMPGFMWLSQRSRHCLPVLPGISSATLAQFFSLPHLATRKASVSCSSGLQRVRVRTLGPRVRDALEARLLRDLGAALPAGEPLDHVPVLRMGGGR